MPDERHLLNRLPLIGHIFDSHMREVVRGAASAFTWRVLGAAGQFVCNMLLARMLGAEGFGLYALAMTVTAFTTVIGSAGLDQTLVRFIPAHADRGETGAIRALFAKGFLATLVVSMSAGFCIFLASGFIAAYVFNNPALAGVIKLMALSVPSWSLVNLIAGSLQGLKRIHESTLIMVALLPFINMALIYILVSAGYGVYGAAAAYLISTCVVVVIGLVFWFRGCRSDDESGRMEAASTAKLVNTAIPMALTSLMVMGMSLADTLILGAMRPPAELGVYSGALKLSTIASMALMAFSAIAAPKFASFYAERDVSAIQRIGSHSIRLILALAAPVFALSLIAPGFFMSLFGASFKTGASALVILTLGQVVYMTFGLAGQLLLMTGQEVAVRNITLAAAIVNIILCLVLIPPLGATGAALSHTASFSMTALLSQYVLKRHMNIYLHPF
ncbi:MAG: flippase [Deltaproteobacteria bacterium]|nr:flippase [Deltaproteobacteria bacterium]